MRTEVGHQEATEEILKDGWLATGDIATVDDEGYFYIVDRKKDMILVSGFNVFPNEIEEVAESTLLVFTSTVVWTVEADATASKSGPKKIAELP